jgi:hypothetical protein
VDSQAERRATFVEAPHVSVRIAWAARVTPAFLSEVRAICTRLNWDTVQHANWLMACMAFESAETFSPSIRNAAGSGAVGLIQFMPATAHYLGTTDAALASMTSVDQLAYVEKYFEPFARRIKSLSDMYMAILLPRYIGLPDDAALFSQGAAYRQNSGLDMNRDGKITKGEATALVQKKLERGLGIGFALSLPA